MGVNGTPAIVSRVVTPSAVFVVIVGLVATLVAGLVSPVTEQLIAASIATGLLSVIWRVVVPVFQVAPDTDTAVPALVQVVGGEVEPVNGVKLVTTIRAAVLAPVANPVNATVSVGEAEPVLELNAMEAA